MKQRFLSEGSTLMDVWCKDIPNSDNTCRAMDIGELVEQTDEYEIYKAYDMTGLCTNEFKIKIYLDENVKAGGNLHLAQSSDKEVDITGNSISKAVVYEVIEGDFDSIFCSATASDANAETPQLISVVDEDSGEVFEIDKEHYVWKDGRKTKMWFTDKGDLIDPVNGTKAHITPCYFADFQDEDISQPQSHSVEEDNPAEKKGFDAVAGMDDLKKEMLDEVKFVIENKEKAKKYGLHMPNGMLLYGYPGCGKTFFAQKLAEELGVNFLFKRGSDLGSHWMHETEQNIGTLFASAKSQAPCIICIDEIDGFLPYRRGGDDTSSALLNSEVNEFLSQMNNCGKDNVMVIGTSNNPSLLDPALLRTGRMDKLVYVPLPDDKARQEMIKLMLEKVPHDEDIDLPGISEACEGMVMSDIEVMFHQLVLQCAREDKALSTEMLTEAGRGARRSVYIPKETDNEQEKQMILKPADTHIKGFSMAI